jgi:predicted RNase H-like nuclease (RuvC/YqgF family)
MRYKQHSYTFENNKLELLEDSKKDIGLIAQEVYELIPEAVLKPEDERKDIWAMNYPKLIPVLIKAIQEQQTQIDKLEKENNGLKSVNNTVDKKYNELKAALEKLESYIYSEAKK